MAERTYVMSLWVRAWHWTNAALMLLLILSGISLHFAAPDSFFLIRFDLARTLHNVCGLALATLYAVYVLWNFVSGNWRHYVPRAEGFFTELALENAYVAKGIFKGEAPPVVPTPERKFNVVQQMTYLVIMYGAMPLLVASGLLFMFPELVPEELFGMAGLLPVAVTHYVVGFLLTLFLFGHIYMGTMGVTPLAGFRMVITGWHEEHDSSAPTRRP